MHRTEKRTKHRILYRVLLIVLIVAVLAGVLSFVVFAQTSYVITDGENVTVCRSFSSDLSTVLNEAGISLGAEDTYTDCLCRRCQAHHHPAPANRHHRLPRDENHRHLLW